MQPEKRFKVGACSASVFVNEIETVNGKTTLKTVNLQRTYKDKNGEFQHTTSFTVNDIPKAVLALNKAFDTHSSTSTRRWPTIGTRKTSSTGRRKSQVSLSTSLNLDYRK